MRRLWVGALLVAACGGDDSGGASPDAGMTIVGNPAREIADTQLTFDVGAMSGTATITFGSSPNDGATLEVGDLTIDSTSVPSRRSATQLDLALPASVENSTVEIAFHYATHNDSEGAADAGWTLIWPYYCGNLFPCHSQPADGTTFSLALTGVEAGKTAVYPTMLGEAPSYQIAWAIGDYTEKPLGTTGAGTQVSVWYGPSMEADADQGTVNLVAAFNWFEEVLGPYPFGPKAGAVPVEWGVGAYGGMEHHPYWHVATSALSDQETNVHEAAHGWFGDGIRIQCWEDFVLSEGTVSYLAARALDVVAPTVGQAVWNSYASNLAQISGTAPVWPDSCGSVDILADHLFSNAPYMRGAFFYKAVADKYGADVVDTALHEFYVDHAGSSATMQQMIDKLNMVTGSDVTSCAQMWLRSTTKPAIGPCP